MALLDKQGKEIPLRLKGEASAQGTELVLRLTQNKQCFVFEDIGEQVVPSLLRGFSAPVVLHYPYQNDELAHLMANDPDPVNRWEAGQRLATSILLEGVKAYETNHDKSKSWIPQDFTQAFSKILACAFDKNADPAFVAEAMVLPSESYLAGKMQVINPDAIHFAYIALRRHISQELEDSLFATYERATITASYAPDPKQTGLRALRNICLAYLSEMVTGKSIALAFQQFQDAKNMTDCIFALSTLAQIDCAEASFALESFYSKWKNEALVVDKWLTVQACSRLPRTGETVRALMAHESFDLRNPNKVYALVQAFCANNFKHFHAEDGSGYKLASDVILQLDPINPQVASRIARSFDRWRRFNIPRQQKAREQLERISRCPNLSGDVAEVIGQALTN